MFGLQPLHIVLIVIIALLIFGPSRLGNLGRAFGKMFSEFRSAAKEPSEGTKQNASNSPSAKGSPKKA